LVELPCRKYMVWSSPIRDDFYLGSSLALGMVVLIVFSS